jgi:hypothetical protein
LEEKAQIMSDSIFLETTTIAASRSIAEITAELVKNGARQIATTYSPEGNASGVRWLMILYGDKPVWFQMPAKVDPVYNRMYKRAAAKPRRRGPINSQELRAQAERIAWRQLLMWVKVQMAMIQHGMAEYAQVFLPYVEDPRNGRTVWDTFSEQQFKAIDAPKQ